MRAAATNCQSTLLCSYTIRVRRRPLVRRQHDTRLSLSLQVRTSAVQATTAAPEELAEYWGSYQDDELGGPPSYGMLHAQHKQQLSVAERQQLAVRLRRALHRLPPGMDTPCPLLVRLFRYAVDDLRLFQAIHAAGMEGTIVVVDDPDEADVLLATPRKRTGKEVPLAEAKRLAETRGLPFVSLRTLSGVRLMKALSPIMGIPVPPHLLPGAQQQLQQPQPLKATRPDVDASRKVLELLGRGGQGKQQQQQQQQQKARVPPPEHCPHSRLGLRRMRMEQSSTGAGGYKVEGLGKVVNTIELSSSTIKQLLRDSRPLLDHTRLERCSLRTALLQPKVPTNLPYLPLGAASDVPLLLLPPPSYYYPTPTMDASTEGALRPSIPPEVSAVPELAFALHESGLCSPSHLTPELQWLVYEALGWGAQPVGLQQHDQHADQKQRQQQQQRTERARCRSQAERSKRPEVPVKQRSGPSRDAAQCREAANNGHRFESGGGTQAGPEVGQEEGLQGGDLQELGGPNGQVLGDQDEGFEGEEEQEQSQQEQHHCQQQDAGEQDVEESEGGGGNLHGSKLWRDVQFELGVGSQGAQDGFTARTHKLLLHLQQLFLGREGDRKGKGRDLLESPTKKRRTQQAEKGKGRLQEVSMIMELLAEQLQAAAKAQAPCERGKSGTERHTSLGASACPAPSHRICAARTFHDMLVLQSKGYVRVKQDESYGDLHVREGQKLVKCVGDLPLAHE